MIALWRLLAAQPDLVVYTPGRDAQTFGGERFLPRQYVGIDTIEKGAIQVEN
jgi:hypothetical protein